MSLLSASSLSLSPTTHTDLSIDGLRRRVQGTVVLEGDDGYTEAIAAWTLNLRQRPLVAVVARSASDVAEAVRFAAAHRLSVGVQATGHGARPVDGGMLIVTASLRDVTVDPINRTARVAAGAKWQIVLDAAQEHGLAPLLGSTPDVGAVGYTLGGGMGWLGRKHGLASDSVRSFDLVTPEGLELRASSDENAELFFALRGGGAGSLGVVTAMEIELYPVTTVYGGNLFYPASMAAEVLSRWSAWITTVPEELTTAVCLMNFPPIEDVPEPLRGQSFVLVRGVFSGDLAEGQALIDEWRAWRAPALDLFGPMAFRDIAAVSMDPVDPMPHTLSTEWFDELAPQAIDIIVKATFVPAGPPQLVFTELRHAGGAIARNAVMSAARRGRRGTVLMTMLGVPMDGHHEFAITGHIRDARKALAPYVTGDTYLNFTDHHERRERTAEAFTAEDLRRVQSTKRVVDGENRFRHGFAL